MPMTQDAKDRTCENLKGMTIESMAWSPPDEHGDGYWVMTFTNGAEICFSRMQAELALSAADRLPRVDVLVLDGRERDGMVIHGKDYVLQANLSVGEVVCLDGYWIDLNGFTLMLDRHTHHASFHNGARGDRG